MSKTTKKESTDYPDFCVRYETLSGYFEPRIPRSTFHDLVNKGRVVPMKELRGYYLLNASLRRLGLPQVRELPKPPDPRTLEDIVRLAFTLIDPDLFPAPSWLLDVEAIDIKDCDHARMLADQHRNQIEAQDHVHLKMAYFQGVLDAAHMLKTDAE